MSGPVSVSENRHLQQKISWQPPVSGDISMYLVRYGMGGSNLENASFSVTTPNISILLTLPVPDSPPVDMLVYNIWVAVVTNSQEQGNATALTIQYSSELQLVIIQVLQCVSLLADTYCNPKWFHTT